MNKSILLLAAIILFCFSCNENKTDTVKQAAIANPSLATASITGAIQPDQDCEQLKRNYIALDSSLKEFQFMFDAAIIRLDSLTGYNNELEKKLIQRNSEIEKLRQKIKTLTTKKVP